MQLTILPRVLLPQGCKHLDTDVCPTPTAMHHRDAEYYREKLLRLEQEVRYKHFLSRSSIKVHATRTINPGHHHGRRHGQDQAGTQLLDLPSDQELCECQGCQLPMHMLA